MKRLLFILLSCSAAYAQQNALLLPWTPQQFTNTNGTVLANGKVCTYQAGTSTGLATYTDSTASVANNVPPNAILLDSTGRPTSGGIWLKTPLAYKITVLTAGSDSTCNTGVIIKTQDQVITGSGAGLNLNNTFTGTNTFLGLLQCKNFENVQCVDSTLSRGGSDIGAELNLAYAALPASGGVIWLFPKADGTNYNYSTPIVFGTSVKPVRLECYGASTPTPTANGACVLNYTPTTATAAITLDYGFAGSGSGIEQNHGIQNVTFINNACFTNGGCGSSASGIKIGNTNGGAGQATFRVRVIGFGTGMDGTSVAGFAFGMHFDHCSWVDNTLAVNMGAGTENVVFAHNMFVSNGQEFTATGGDTYFYSSSFDGHTNTSGGINLNWNGRAKPSFAEFTDCHFEANLNTNDHDYIIGNGNWKIKGGILAIDATVGNVTRYFTAGGAYISIMGLTLSGSGQTATQIIDTTPGAVRGRVEIIFWNFASKPTICGGGNCSGITDASYLSDLSNPATVQTLSASAFAPNTAGATDIGTTALPWGNLWLGTAATNNFKFAPAATGAARVISIPDPGVNTNLALNLTATSAAFATATTAGTCVQNTTAVSGAATTMAVSVSPASTPGVGAVWSGFVSSAGNVTINECAVATSAGGSIAFNIRVTP